MKILLVTHRYPPKTGGIETHVKELATQFVDRGHDVTVFSADAGSGVTSKQDSDGVRLRRFRSLHPGSSIYVAPQLAAAVRRAEADIVHAHNYHALPLFFAALGVSNEQFVVTPHYHGGSASRIRDRLLSVYRRLGRWALRQADARIVVSEWEREQIATDFGLDATVIPNGIDVGRFRAATPEERDRPYILCVGRLEAYKGIQHVIRTLPSLQEYELLVAGDGPYQEELKRIARENGVEDRVEFLGYVDDDRLPQLYRGARVYVTVSEFEAYGMTVAEALATRTPCVVRDAGALSDWIGNDGVVGIDETDVETIREACLRAAELSSVSAEKLLDWNEVTERVLATYHD